MSARRHWPLMAEEFPQFDQATLPDIPEGWEDVSWGAENCPSFQLGEYLHVYVDELDPARREFPELPRFVARFVAGPMWCQVDDHHLASDDWAQIVSWCTSGPGAKRAALLDRIDRNAID